MAPGAGAKAKLASADRVLVTVPHLRKLGTLDFLGQLFNTTAIGPTARLGSCLLNCG